MPRVVRCGGTSGAIAGRDRCRGAARRPLRRAHSFRQQHHPSERGRAGAVALGPRRRSISDTARATTNRFDRRVHTRRRGASCRAGQVRRARSRSSAAGRAYRRSAEVERFDASHGRGDAGRSRQAVSPKRSGWRRAPDRLPPESTPPARPWKPFSIRAAWQPGIRKRWRSFRSPRWRRTAPDGPRLRRWRAQDFDPVELARSASEKARLSRNPREVAPGRYTVSSRTRRRARSGGPDVRRLQRHRAR